ncbi:DUF4232 domain-containing protein [Streptomyces sp. NPDC058195]|uniref:DUF4232 domain-containing protein n=1 Tax=Streptomyces sp. NPDC058195 TaxID=3346375 RepID=UPI0036EEDE83
MRVHQLTFAALAAAAAFSLTACQNDENGTGRTGPSSAAYSFAGGRGSGGSDQGDGQVPDGRGAAGEGTAARTVFGKENGGRGTCRTGELEITAVDGTVGGDAEGTVAVGLKNSGGRDCVLSAYAGVDLKTSAGTVSAKRTGEKTTAMTLKDGKSVYFGITYPFDEPGGSGVRITGLVVTPPNETKPVTLAWPGEPTLPVTDGSGSRVRVGPMGSAGQGG